MLRAYNDWHVDEWCGKYPGRFVPLAIPPIWDVEEMAREVHRVAKKGCHAITFADTPGGLGYPSLHSEHWDPFWKACADEGTVVCIHIGSGTGMNLQDPNAPVEIMIASTPISLFGCATELVFSDIFAKFPTLKIALSEGGIGWIPYFLERIDYVHEHHHHWTHHNFPGGKRPSDVFREHVLGCFIDDAAGVRSRDLIGVDNITWECDYPHSDTTWPTAPERLWKSLAGVPDADIHKITWQNVVRWFQYDPFKHIPKEECTVARAARAGEGRRPVRAQGRRRQGALRLRARLCHDRRHHEADRGRVLDRLRQGGARRGSRRARAGAEAPRRAGHGQRLVAATNAWRLRARTCRGRSGAHRELHLRGRCSPASGSRANTHLAIMSSEAPFST